MGKSGAQRQRGDISLSLSLEERQLISLKAEMYDMADSAFVRLVVLGCLAQGGGLLDRMIRNGAEGKVVQRRMGRNYEREWSRIGEATAGPMPAIWGRGRWRLVSKRTQPGGRSQQSDQRLFWQLQHLDVPGVSRPMAWHKDVSMRRAVELIESLPDATPYEVLTRYVTFGE